MKGMAYATLVLGAAAAAALMESESVRLTDQELPRPAPPAPPPPPAPQPRPVAARAPRQPATRHDQDRLHLAEVKRRLKAERQAKGIRHAP